MIKLKKLLLENLFSHEFRRWFRNSKVVDANGQPMVVYKGMTYKDDMGNPITKIQRQSEFPTFNDPEDKGGVKLAGFFTNEPSVAKKFAFGKEAEVRAFFLRIENPFVIDMKGAAAGLAQFGKSGRPFRDAIRSGKYDGVIILNTKDEKNVFVPLHPSQVKAIDNKIFDPDSEEFTKE